VSQKTTRNRRRIKLETKELTRNKKLKYMALKNKNKTKIKQFID
jgi:hypothetical protein